MHKFLLTPDSSHLLLMAPNSPSCLVLHALSELSYAQVVLPAQISDWYCARHALYCRSPGSLSRQLCYAFAQRPACSQAWLIVAVYLSERKALGSRVILSPLGLLSEK
ncbi:hypothetical protein OE88DRAFT_1508143 [Heliocybe sulcata]|uniref:Uncharacterized protein n=1 Tax=Heliocybe sulcata TaxID=5364 RepID=A0A5C3N875_9AGAM|nr:hypothetical protein OE88DRAFT_1508143 [Heliocybe sulcata]